MSKPNTSIKYGSIFRVGRHVVACGDARDKEFVDRVIGQAKIKSVIVDVPYGVKAVEMKEGFSKIKMPKKILNDDITDEAEYAKFTKDWIEPVLPHLTPKNTFYIFNADPMLFALRQGMKDAGVKFSQLLIWIKSQPTIGRKDYLCQHELLAYGWHGAHLPPRAKDKSVLWCPKVSSSPLHPTQKPVQLLRRLILNSSDIGDVVYDCCAGSGTLGVSAQQTQRSAILIERDEDYCQTILTRMEKLFGLKPERMSL